MNLATPSPSSLAPRGPPRLFAADAPRPPNPCERHRSHPHEGAVATPGVQVMASRAGRTASSSPLLGREPQEHPRARRDRHAAARRVSGIAGAEPAVDQGHRAAAPRRREEARSKLRGLCRSRPLDSRRHALWQGHRPEDGQHQRGALEAHHAAQKARSEIGATAHYTDAEHARASPNAPSLARRTRKPWPKLTETGRVQTRRVSR